MSAPTTRTITAVCAAAMFASALTACSHGSATLTVGALYPLTGPQGPGGVEEYHGVRVAAAMTS